MGFWADVLTDNDNKYRMRQDKTSQFFANINNAYEIMHNKNFESCSSVFPWRFGGFTRFDNGYTYIVDTFAGAIWDETNNYTYIIDNTDSGGLTLDPFGLGTFSFDPRIFTSNTISQNGHKIAIWVEIAKMSDVALAYRQKWLYPPQAVPSEVAPDMGINGSYTLLENSDIENDLYCVKSIHYYINDNDGEYSESNPRKEYVPKNNFYPNIIIPYEVNSYTKENTLWNKTFRMFIPLGNVLGIYPIGGMGRITSKPQRQHVANFYNGTGAYLLGYNIYSYIECNDSFVDAQKLSDFSQYNAFHTVYFTKSEIEKILNDFGVPWSFDINNIQYKNTVDYPDYKKPGKPTNPVNPDGGDGDNYSDPMLPVVPSISPYDCYATTYICRKSDINALSNYMWSDDFITQVKKIWESPGELITANVFFPLNLAINTAGTAEQIKIGNCNAPENCTGIAIDSTYSRRISSDEYTVNPYFGNFLDYEPYSKYYIYLPYIGFQQLSASDIVGAKIHVEYVLELETGNCTAYIYSGERLISQTNGACGAQIGLSSSNNIMKNISLIGAGFKTASGVVETKLNTAGAILGSNSFGDIQKGINTISSGINDFINAFQMQTISPSDKVVGLNGLYAPQDCYLIAVHPTPSEAKNLKEIFGRAASYGGTVSELSGFLQCSAVDGYTRGTDDENNEIFELLRGGIYV